MPGLTSIEQIRSVEWATEYLWDIYIPSAPAPFNEWFPAIDFDEGLLTIESYSWDGYLQGYSVPQNTQPVDVTLTFADADDGRLLKWFSSWVDDIFPGYIAVNNLSSIVREIYIKKLNRQRELIWLRDYQVYPEGGINEHGSSESSLKTYSVTLKCVG